MGPQRLITQEFYSETRRQDVRRLRNGGNDLLVPDGCGSQPIEILHILREIFGEFGFGHPADPADKFGAGERFHRRSSIDTLQIAK
jgi:hypothetical protein